jgi:hypothetical protein
MARRGLNATLSYPQDGKIRAYRVRCINVTHGFQLVATESAGRTERALYPMKQVPTPFSITVALIGYREHTHFSNWLSTYAMFALNPDRGGSYPEMSVSVPSRNFSRRGVPKTGMEYGDHVGAILWNRVVTFETTAEPWDSGKPKYSRYEDPENAQAYRENRYFYPAGIQLSGNQTPADGTYVPIVNPGDATTTRQDKQDYADTVGTYDSTPITFADDGSPEEGTS